MAAGRDLFTPKLAGNREENKNKEALVVDTPTADAYPTNKTDGVNNTHKEVSVANDPTYPGETLTLETEKTLKQFLKEHVERTEHEVMRLYSDPPTARLPQY